MGGTDGFTLYKVVLSPHSWICGGRILETVTKGDGGGRELGCICVAKVAAERHAMAPSDTETLFRGSEISRKSVTARSCTPTHRASNEASSCLHSRYLVNFAAGNSATHETISI